MTRSSICLTLLSAAVAVWGQAAAPAAAPAFEVASIRPSPPNPPGTPNPPISEIDKARVKLHLPMQGIICAAYGVRADQVVGPAWLTNTRFDIEAKLPADATLDQVPVMLQTLLAERFKMTVHRESREQSVYALIVGKDGLKMKAKALDPSSADAAPAATRDGCYPHAGQGAGPGGRGSTIANGDMKMSTGENGVLITMSRIPSLVEWLTTTMRLFSGLSGGPSVVIDKTNLKGEYDIHLEQKLVADTGAIAPGQSPAPLGDPWFFGALEKLGLKLERQKAPIETIVIDQIEKTPTEN
jgi:uncharacterized protein (TIGR03435 family)